MNRLIDYRDIFAPSDGGSCSNESSTNISDFKNPNAYPVNLQNLKS